MNELTPEEKRERNKPYWEEYLRVVHSGDKRRVFSVFKKIRDELGPKTLKLFSETYMEKMGIEDKNKGYPH